MNPVIENPFGEHLAGPVGRTCDFLSQGHEFKSHIGQSFPKNKIKFK